MKNIILKVSNANIEFRELFVATNSTSEYVNSQRLFLRSCATMNILGFLVGLGDRHLGNILINFTNGCLTHIDFNICFDRGKLLSIPETVPFRLTRNFIKTFGSFGYHGNYSHICTKLLEFTCENNYILDSFMKNQVFDDCSEWACNNKLRNLRSIKRVIEEDSVDDEELESKAYTSACLFVTQVLNSLVSLVEITELLESKVPAYKRYLEESHETDVTCATHGDTNEEAIVERPTHLPVKELLFYDLKSLFSQFLTNQFDKLTSSHDLVVVDLGEVLLNQVTEFGIKRANDSSTNSGNSNKNASNIKKLENSSPKNTMNINNSVNTQNMDVNKNLCDINPGIELIREWEENVDRESALIKIKELFQISENIDLDETFNVKKCSDNLMNLQAEYMEISSKHRSLNENLPNLQNSYSSISLNLSNMYEGMSRKSSALMGCCAYLQMYKQKLEVDLLNKLNLFTNAGFVELTNIARYIGYVNIILRFLMTSDSNVNLDQKLCSYANYFNQIPKLFGLYEGFYYSLKASILPMIQHRNVLSVNGLTTFYIKVASLLAQNPIYVQILSETSFQEININKKNTSQASNLFNINELTKKESCTNELYQTLSQMIENTFCGVQKPYSSLFQGILTLFNCLNSALSNIVLNLNEPSLYVIVY